MAEKSQSPNPLAPVSNGYARSDQSPTPLAPVSNGHAQSDEESAAAHLEELKKRKRRRCRLFMILFTLLQIVGTLVSSLVIMPTRNPKFRVGSGSFVDTFDVGTEASPTFNLRMNTQFTVKNTNFGPYKYESVIVTFAYRGRPVGHADIQKARAKSRSTKKVDIVVNLSSNNFSNTNELGRDISLGVIPLTSYSKLHGKVHLMMNVIKIKKSAQMNCTMEVAIATRTLRNIICK